MKLICCEIAWMENYNGWEDNVSTGGEYVRLNGFGHEEINFRNDNGYYKGYVQTINSQINLERIGQDVHNDELDDVLVVWCARNPRGNRTIVGYYNHATAYRFRQERNNERCPEYSFKARVEDSRLLTIEERNFVFDGERRGNIGQANVWYADSPESREQRQRIIDYVNTLIDQQEMNFEEINDVNNIQIGNKIEHPLYGIGEIKNITNDCYVIYFPSCGVKKITIEYVKSNCKLVK